MYACLGCGFVVDKRKIIKSRVDRDGSPPGCGPYPQKAFHGYVYEWKCPECDHLIYIRSEKD